MPESNGYDVGSYCACDTEGACQYHEGRAHHLVLDMRILLKERDELYEQIDWLHAWIGA